MLDPYGMRFDEITASNLVTVNLDGSIVGEALKLMYSLERSCKAPLALQSSGAADPPPVQSVKEKTVAQYHSFDTRGAQSNARDREWEAYLRLARKVALRFDL